MSKLKIVVLIMLFVFVGCGGVDGSSGTNGDKGEKGDTGPAGPAGPAGVSTTEFVCRDATGALVFNGDRCIVLDANGVQWNLDFETAQVSSTVTGWIFYTQASCMGTAYVYYPTSPGVAFKLVGETNFRVRPDTLKSVEVVALSANMSGTCMPNYALTARMLPLQAILSTTPVTPPTTNFVAPLRL